MQGLFRLSLPKIGSAEQALEQQNQIIPQTAEEAAFVDLFQGHQGILGDIFAIEFQEDGAHLLSLLDGGIEFIFQLEVGLELATAVAWTTRLMSRSVPSLISLLSPIQIR